MAFTPIYKPLFCLNYSTKIYISCILALMPCFCVLVPCFHALMPCFCALMPCFCALVPCFCAPDFVLSVPEFLHYWTLFLCGLDCFKHYYSMFTIQLPNVPNKHTEFLS